MTEPTRLPRRFRHRAAADRQMPRVPRGKCLCSCHAVLHAGPGGRCETPGCGCGSFRPVSDVQQSTPYRLREGVHAGDDSCEPRRRSDMGARQPWDRPESEGDAL